MDDGYTHKSYLKATPRLHDECRFEHRPLTYSEQRQIRDKISAFSGAAYAKVVAELIVRFVTKWDAKDRKGQPVPLKVANINADVEPVLIEAIASVVLRVSAPDADPLGESEVSIAPSLDAVLGDALPVDLREADDAKN